jgi:hypothetical protein
LEWALEGGFWWWESNGKWDPWCSFEESLDGNCLKWVIPMITKIPWWSLIPNDPHKWVMWWYLPYF